MQPTWMRSLHWCPGNLDRRQQPDTTVVIMDDDTLLRNGVLMKKFFFKPGDSIDRTYGWMRAAEKQ